MIINALVRHDQPHTDAAFILIGGFAIDNRLFAVHGSLEIMTPN